LHLGVLASAVIFAFAFAVPGLIYWRFRVHPILCFWVAYVLTRPLGASIADWLGVPRVLSGLGWGRGHVALFFAVVFVALVAYVQITGVDVQPEPGLEPVQRPSR
jgi:uncharacterized membrane-anchored protein